MLKIDHLTICHKKDNRVLLKDFSLTLQDGDRAVLIGEEGNGKSTLLQQIYDEELTKAYTEVSGDIQRRNHRFGYLPQEMPEHVKRMRAVEFFDTVLDDGNKVREAALLAGKLQIPAGIFESAQLMESFSGGEKVKLQMMALLLMEPDVLLLDEPSNDIDIETLQWMEKFLLQCRVPVLFVSHDEVLIEKTANIIIHMEQTMRKTVPVYTIAKMSYGEYIASRNRRIELQTREAHNEKREYDAKQERLRRIEQKVEHQQNIISRQNPAGGRLLKKKMKAVKSMERRFEKEAEDMTKVPDVEEEIFVTFAKGVRIPNGKTVLDFWLDEVKVKMREGNTFSQGDILPEERARVLAKDIKLAVYGSEKICIIGKNGCGKSTLLREIYEYLKERNFKIGYMPQNYEEVLPFHKTPVEFLAVTGSREETTRIRTYLGSLKYTADEMMHPAAELSGGQKAKLLFLKMSMEECEVLLLDEPTRNFSPLSNPVVRKALRAFPGAIISISHDRKYISMVCDKVYELKREGLVLQDKTSLQE